MDFAEIVYHLQMGDLHNLVAGYVAQIESPISYHVMQQVLGLHDANLRTVLADFVDERLCKICPDPNFFYVDQESIRTNLLRLADHSRVCARLLKVSHAKPVSRKPSLAKRSSKTGKLVEELRRTKIMGDRAKSLQYWNTAKT